MNFINQPGQARALWPNTHVRLAPTPNAPVIAYRQPGQTMEIAGYTTEGALVNGSSVWYRTTGFHWVSATVVRFQPTNPRPVSIPFQFVSQAAAGIPPHAANVRVAPRTSAALVAQRFAGEVIHLSGYTDHGENVNGDSRWWRTTGGNWVSNNVIQISAAAPPDQGGGSSGSWGGGPVGVLSVPYASQWDADAGLDQPFDCGPACLHMVLGYLGIGTSTNAVMQATGAGIGRVILVNELLNAAPHFGVGLEYHSQISFAQVADWLRHHRPIIALIHYGDIPGRQDVNPNAAGGHFVVIVGLTPDEIVVCDPDFWGADRSRGDQFHISRGAFRTAWENSAQDGATPFSGLVPDRGGA